MIMPHYKCTPRHCVLNAAFLSGSSELAGSFGEFVALSLNQGDYLYFSVLVLNVTLTFYNDNKGHTSVLS